MRAWLRQRLPWLVLDVLAVLVLAVPDIGTYMRWPLLALYALVAWQFFKGMREHRWVIAIVSDRRTRIVHGLEHATLAILDADGLPAIHGFTHGKNRFVVALRADAAPDAAVIRKAAESAIRRIRSGERALAYQPGCGTSELVSIAALWLVFIASALLALALGGSPSLVLSLGLIVFRFWIASHVPLGLLAQRLFTVSTDFTAASVVGVLPTTRENHLRCPTNEVWYEVIVELGISASSGGPVAPGVFA